MIQSIGWSDPINEALPPPKPVPGCALFVLRPSGISGPSVRAYHERGGAWVCPVSNRTLDGMWRGSRFAVVRLPGVPDGR